MKRVRQQGRVVGLLAENQLVRNQENEATTDREAVSKHIPTDVIAEILSRLPVKSIGQCKTVSKEWRSIIRNPNFSTLHAKNQPFSTFYGTKMNGSLCTSYVLELYENRRFGKINFKGKVRGPRSAKCVVGACNGLICVLDRNSRSDTISIVNPITKESITLPDHDYRCADTGKYAPTNAAYAFGYSPWTKQYKVLKRVVKQYEIFTVGLDDSWRKLSLDHCSFPGDVLLQHKMLHFNGAFCWLVSGLLHDNQPFCIIIAFDIAEEKARQMQIPRSCQLDNNNQLRLRLIVLDNSLYFKRYHAVPADEVPSTIWKMAAIYGDGDSWISNTPLSGFIAQIPILDITLLNTTKDEMVLFRIGQGRDLHSCRPDGTKRTVIRLRHFVESLFQFTPTFAPIDMVVNQADV